MNQKPFIIKHFLLSVFFLAFASALSAQTKFKLTSAAFDNGKAIPARYTCVDENVLPALNWSNIPTGTKSFAIIMDDPDAPMGTWVHWVIYNIPATITSLHEGAGAADVKANDGLNSWDEKGYSGPCPPSGTHRYIFKIFALDKILGISDMTEDALLDAMKGHIVGQAQLNGTFQKP